MGRGFYFLDWGSIARMDQGLFLTATGLSFSFHMCTVRYIPRQLTDRAKK